MNIDDLKKFWVLVADVWQNGLGGVDIGRTIIALLILFAFFVLRGLIAKFLIGWLRRLAKSTEWRIDDDIVDAIQVQDVEAADRLASAHADQIVGQIQQLFAGDRRQKVPL